MRVHRLRFQAIGPFPDEHVIDVDRLAAGGLFLLEGPTGAGKSTIIDAVVFALYGQVAGAEASGDRLHSDHAAAGVEPFVEMVFSTAAGLYRVWRSPKFERPKQRGTGTVTQNARAKLWRLSCLEDAGEPLSAQVQEVGGELGRIVALDRAQFTQTVVLPQGQFASFLRARPEDRRAVLQEVFGTEVYEQVQKQLAEMAKDARARLAGAAQEVGTAVAAFVQAAGLDDDAALRDELQAAADDLDAAVLTGRTQEICERSARTASVTAAAERDARARERAAQQELDTRRDLAHRLTRRTSLLAEQRELDARADHVRAAAERLARARRAATVTGALRSRATARRRHEQALTDLHQRLDSLPEPLLAGTATEIGPADLAALRQLIEDSTAQRGALTQLLSVEAGLPARTTQLNADQEALEAAAARVGRQREELDARPTRRAELEERAAAAGRQAAALDGARTTLELALGRLTGAERAEERVVALEAVTAAVHRAAEAARIAVDAEHAVRRRWVDGMAGELARTLEPGCPCPVCGSAEHPAPARPGAEHVDGEAVEAASAARRRAEEGLASARTAQVRAEEQLAAAQDAAQGRRLDQARDEAEAARAAVSDAQDAARRAGELTAELSAFDQQTAQLTEALAEERSALDTARARLANAREQLEADRDRCASAAGAAGTVAAHAAGLDARITTAKQLGQHLEERLSAATALTEAEESLTAALDEAEFADAESAQAAALPPAEIDSVEHTVQEHRAAVARVAAGLAESGIAELSGHEEADVDGAAQAHRRTQEELTEATRRCAAAQACADRSGQARTVLVQALQRHTAHVAAAAPALRMANLATAGEGNEATTTLATFVLLRRFEDVVSAANERLSVMSDGRYSLERIDTEGGQRSRRAGLGLQVRDHLTETPRDPHTLSGGETFYVSLCLALGLADVVRSEAGGIELGTLFVDEGFGSLDPDTLDDVMAELGKLQSGGRAVGIVSHVAELKGRIAERIEVRRLPAGASTLTVRA